jgi:hypothetical protein
MYLFAKNSAVLKLRSIFKGYIRQVFFEGQLKSGVKRNCSFQNTFKAL